MNDQPAKSGFSDNELATHPTVFAAEALKDRVVMVSGASGGIGRAIAFLFARLGAHVALVGRNQEKLDTLFGHLAANGLKASAHVADIRDHASVEALFDAVWSTQGR